VITPRRTRLVRAPDLRSFQKAIARAACAGGVADARSCAIIVSTRAAAEELVNTLEGLLLPLADTATTAAFAWPEILTRDGFYDCLHQAMPDPPGRLTPVEREVLLERAAREAAAGNRPPFSIRSALVVEMLAFLDNITRLGRSLDAFERLFVERLEPAVSLDRGAERLLRQTRFLVAAYRRYRQLASQSGAVDEHLLRERVRGLNSPFNRVVVTVGDRGCGPEGLWPVDFDLLARLPGLEHLDVIATENTLASGFHERLQDALPGFEEVDALGDQASRPVLVRPEDAGTPWWVSRDREEEVASIARRIKARFALPDLAAPHTLPALSRIAIVCRRPLPYVYLARSYLVSAGIPFEAFDELPLAAEPFSAALDLVLRTVQSGGARGAMTALLASPHFVFTGEDGVISPHTVAALDRAWREAGGARELEPLVRQWSLPGAKPRQAAAVRGARAALAVESELARLGVPQPASRLFDGVLSFLVAHLRRRDHSGPQPAEEQDSRAREAVISALAQLRAAHELHDDPVSDFEQIVPRIRRWIEAQTFSPRSGASGVHLLDAEAARYGDFDEVHLVGLVEGEWPETSAVSIFYPLSLLGLLGWPSERSRLASARASFMDLLRLPARSVSASTFVLEEDALVEPSPFLDELGRATLPAVDEAQPGGLRVFPDEALSLDPVRPEVLAGAAGEQALLRIERSIAAGAADGDAPRFDAARFHGSVGPVDVAAHAVRQLETYLDCPFKYFAQSVLRLEDESDEDPVEGPRAQGIFLHEILGEFYTRWQAAGHREISIANIDDARSVFAGLVEEKLARLSAAAAGLWRARLLGTPARTGVGEIVLRAEAAGAEPVVERLLEHRFDGPCRLDAGNEAAAAIPLAEGARREVVLRGVADRVDVLEGDRFRVIDYKLGRAPDLRRAIQLPVYAVQTIQYLRARGAAGPVVADAAYLAFGERRSHARLATRADRLQAAVRKGIERTLSAVSGIEDGSFPPRPAERFMCRYCPYSAVCREDYVDER
jgi:RecB family exonuclease